MIAPTDYENYIKSGKERRTKSPPKTNLSQLPTALIAPADYENFLDKNRKKSITKPVKQQPISELPTALIAPGDYENYLHRDDGAKRKPSTPGKAKQMSGGMSELPTALIAPADFENYMRRDGKPAKPKVRPVSETDLPTALLAPDQKMERASNVAGGTAKQPNDTRAVKQKQTAITTSRTSKASTAAEHHARDDRAKMPDTRPASPKPAPTATGTGAVTANHKGQALKQQQGIGNTKHGVWQTP